ncbi:MAG TPA: serine hydrolase domain-containing protein [Gemmatimonadaceae bacterium]|nr:serine hydrolase domain-containing protein [Gemmatimonadaceae bacterium]
MVAARETRKLPRALVAVAVALGSQSLAGAQSAASIDPARVDSIIRKHVADKQIIGVSVGIMQHGKVVFTRGYGMADKAAQRAVTPRTMFAIGSVSKQFTCSAVLMLQEQGKLSMRDPVAKYFPSLTRSSSITLLDLGGHLSGYRDYYPLDYVNREMAVAEPADTIIHRYAVRPLDFEPRSRYSYSNTGYLILGRVVEKVSGESFGTYLSKRIFTPLRLSRTAYEPSPSGSDMARGYTSFGLAEQIPAMPEGAGWAGAAGAIWSTPTDLLTWDLALLDDRIISPASYRVLTTAQRLTDGRSSGYGCGQAINDRGAAVTFSHGGAVSGFVAQNTIIPRTRSALVVLSNSDFSPTGALNQELLALLLPSVDVPAVKGLSALDAAKKFLSELEQGTVDRSTISADFDAFLTPEKVTAAQQALKALGPVSRVRIAGLRERGGMEVAIVQFDVGTTSAQGLMYRTPDGKIEEFLFSRN